MAMQDVGAQGTYRIPPSWTPGTDYTWRDFERDVANWVRLTDLLEEQHCPAVFQRLGGMAKVLAREIPENSGASDRNIDRDVSGQLPVVMESHF